MRRRNLKFLVPLAVVSAAVVAVSGGLASAAATPAGGPVHIYEADTALAGGFGTVVLTGAITDYGTDDQAVAGGGTINRIVLSKGSFEIDLSALSNDLNFPVNRHTCASDGSGTDQVPIVADSGTGAKQAPRRAIRAGRVRGGNRVRNLCRGRRGPRRAERNRWDCAARR